MIACPQTSPQKATTPATPAQVRRAVLASSRLPAARRWVYATEIQRFLKYCEILHLSAGRPEAREYLAIVPLVSARPHARQALRWFFHHADDLRRHRESPRPAPAPIWREGADDRVVDEDDSALN